ncbi:MAG: GntR family transcriptional regulator [Paracoccaceae bacterium]
MQDRIDAIDRPTLASRVFDLLYEDIVSLKLLPGTKLTEVDVARQFGVSPQPVRDAFHRLSDMDLILIRPQRASKVRGFSLTRIEDARFIRLSIELEVAQRAFEIWDNSRAAKLQECLDKQKRCVENLDGDGMQSLDYEFHRSICELGGCPRAFATIEKQKKKMERLCVLEHDHRIKKLESILSDHQGIAQALKARSVEGVLAAARKHLGGLDETIKFIHSTHSEYFEAE